MEPDLLDMAKVSRTTHLAHLLSSESLTRHLVKVSIFQVNPRRRQTPDGFTLFLGGDLLLKLFLGCSDVQEVGDVRGPKAVVRVAQRRDIVLPEA